MPVTVKVLDKVAAPVIAIVFEPTILPVTVVLPTKEELPDTVRVLEAFTSSANKSHLASV